MSNDLGQLVAIRHRTEGALGEVALEELVLWVCPQALSTPAAVAPATRLLTIVLRFGIAVLLIHIVNKTNLIGQSMDQRKGFSRVSNDSAAFQLKQRDFITLMRSVSGIPDWKTLKQSANLSSGSECLWQRVAQPIERSKYALNRLFTVL